MAWVVDQQTKRLRDAALNALESAMNHDSYAQQQVRTIMGVTRSAMGTGHTQGDRLIQDTAQVTECIQRAQSSIQRAMGEVRDVNIMMWVSD
ncbi:MAG: hypothetical protein FWG47_02140 [Propionibacteriaceae bacterium]|nr:hypothetical protein [Propionibacteriaceae bacterium]